MGQVTHVNESFHTYECGTSHDRNKMNEIHDGAVGVVGLRDKSYPKVFCFWRVFSKKIT